MNAPKIKVSRLPFIVLVAIVIGFWAGKYLYKGDKSVSFLPSFGFGKVDEIIQTIDKEYVDTIDVEDLTDKTINFMLDELDPHSAYLRAKDFANESDRMEGNFDGIGIQFSIIDDTLNVLDVIKDGPSFNAGILRGDQIITVDGARFTGIKLSSDSVVHSLRGKKGSKVSLTVWRPSKNDSLNFDVIRGEIPLFSVDVSLMINDNVGIIKVNRFSRTTSDEFRNEFEKLKTQGLKKLILDLRGNPGGLLTQSIELSNQFLKDKDLIMYTKSRDGIKHYYSDDNGIAEDIELAVLIDENSASASEIVSGALQDNDRAVIIGRRTFGKGLVQNQYPLNDGSAFRLTTARYYTPSGRSIQRPYENGVKEYYQEVVERMQNGELTNQDSVHFSEDLKFKTKKGRTVYGGGGIMPDVFVPIDTLYNYSLVKELFDQQLIDRFALRYSLKGLSSDNIKIATSQLKAHGVYESFMEYCGKYLNTKFSEEDFEVSRDYIEPYLFGKILRGIYGNVGLYYPQFIESNEVKKALLELGK